MSEKIAKNLYQKINEIMKRVSYLKKDAQVGYGNNTYTALSHDAVTRALQPELADLGIAHFVSVEDMNVETRMIINKKGVENIRYEVSGLVVTTFVNSENPDEKVIVKSHSMGFDTQDKASGKMLSMGAKYNLLKTFMIESGDKEEDRVEEDKLVRDSEKLVMAVTKSEKSILHTQLIELLKANNKYSIEAEKYVYKLGLGELKSAIERNTTRES